MISTLQMVGLVVTGVLTVVAFWLLHNLRKDSKDFYDFNNKK
ncbi:hypothetical protein [Runella slithyformis]|uniref:Uncharacterized protein n=1 Tax=Runella slithyformis (strain ATCC 29530 / DSM 19594 / LMG 11500 / NCIMB 11436 / LSU 4) TaxID=761193 RepID=A0A7U4E3U9_RUNSL|nr:hypothetical protein [Runella slithyformis]AEI46758.1 hypothetical protein Runsl_0306 [Runella slithyformis DSM 19594]